MGWLGECAGGPKAHCLGWGTSGGGGHGAWHLPSDLGAAVGSRATARGCGNGAAKSCKQAGASEQVSWQVLKQVSEGIAIRFDRHLRALALLDRMDDLDEV